MSVWKYRKHTEDDDKLSAKLFKQENEKATKYK